MRKKLKIISILGLMTILLMSSMIGCSDGNKKATGGFEKISYRLPEEITKVYDIRICNKKMVLIGSDNEGAMYYYSSEDNGKSFNKEYELNDLIITNALIKSDGKVIAIVQSESNENNNCEIYSIDKENMERINIDNEYLENMSLMNINTEDNIYIATNDKIYGFDSTSGKLISENFIKGNINCYAVNKDSLLYACDNKLYKVNLGENDIKDLSNIKGSISHIYLINDYNDKGQFNFIDEEGIYKYSTEKNIKQYFEDNNNIIDYVKINEKEFLVVEDDNVTGITLNKYIYRKDLVKESSKKSVTIYSLYESGSLIDFVNLYNNSNSKINLKYEYGITSDSITEEDAIKTLNSKMLSKAGPDIIILDGLNVDSYIQKGLLDNIEDELDKDLLFDNVYDAYCKDKGEIYAFPLTINIPIILCTEGDSSQLTTLKDLCNQVKLDNKNGIRNIMNIVEPKELINNLYYSCADSWITEDDRVNEENIIEFLEDSKAIYESICNSIDENIKTQHKEYIEDAKRNNVINEWYEYYLLSDKYIKDAVADKIKYNIGYLKDIETLSAIKGAKSLNENLNYSIWQGQETEYFIPSNIVAINKNSKNKKEAKDVIKFLFSEDTQEKIEFYGISTNKDVVINNKNHTDSLMNSEGASISSSFTDINGNDISFQFESLDDKEIEKFISQVSKLKINGQNNKLILNSISDEIEDYMLGKCSIDNTVHNIESQLNIYLSESK